MDVRGVTVNDPDSQTSKRRWCQYSLRTLLVLVTSSAIVCSWYGCEMQKAADRRRAIEEIVRLGGTVQYYNPLTNQGEPLRWYSLLRRIHGDEYLGNAVSVSIIYEFRDDAVDTRPITDAELLHLKGLTSLEGLHLCCPQITDAGLGHLKGLKNLKGLDVSTTQITVEGVNTLRRALPDCGKESQGHR